MTSLLIYLARLLTVALIVDVSLMMRAQTVTLGSSSSSSTTADWRPLTTVAHAANVTTVPPSSATIVTFGYLLMIGVDDRNVLGGFLSVLRTANENDAVKGVRFKVEVTRVDCLDIIECTSLGADDEAKIQSFLDKMLSYTAVLKPNHLLSPRVIDHAIAIGGVPVIDPQTVRLKDYADVSYNVINFEEDIRGQMIHLFTFMQQSSGCAHSGIVYESFSELPSFVESTQKLFTDGNLPKPPALNYDAASADDLAKFFNEDPRRICFILLMTHATEKVMSARVGDRLPVGVRWYAPSMIQGPSFETNGTSKDYENFFFARWSPPYLGSTLKAAADMARRMEGWRTDPNYAGEHALFKDPPTASDGALAGSIVMLFIIDIVRFAWSEHQNVINTGAAVPVPWPNLLATMYNSPRSIGGFPLKGDMTKECPPAPLEQVCFCNSPTLTAYMMRVNGTTGIPYAVFDDTVEGQRGVASDYMSACLRVESSKMYPITMVLFGIKDTRDVSNQRLSIDAMISTQNLMRSTFRRYVYANNYAPVAPVRPLRYVPIILDDNASSTDAMANLVGSYNPFVVIGSIGDTINQSSVLTLMPSITQFVLEDPVLTSPEEWPYNLINLLPALADYIHTLAAFYAQNASLYTSFHAIASSYAEAVLISKSMATFGFDVPVETIVVSISATDWSRTISRWMSSSVSAYPFVMAATVDNPDNVIAAAFDIASSLWSVGRIAVAANTAYFYEIINDQRFTGDMDVIFPCFLQLWWTDAVQANLSAEEKLDANDPTFWYAKIASEFTSELAARVHYDFVTSAADIVYELTYVSTTTFSLGPYYKTPCTAAEIARNERVRICQCTKSISTVYVYSMQDWQQRRDNTRYQYDMLSCGVVYKPYVPPVVDHALSTGAIVGIAVGALIAVVALVVGAIVYNLLFNSRNNRAAPKDSTEPFTVVFTDIQSSTALWARAPAAMSEGVEQHHTIIREVIAKNNGYEVKTIGDSFMIAFKDSHDAVAFALDTQEALFASEWNSEINASYIEILAELEAEAAAEAARAHDESSSAVTTNTNTMSTDVVSMSNNSVGGNNNLRHSQYSLLVGQSASVAAGNLSASAAPTAGGKQQHTPQSATSDGGKQKKGGHHKKTDTATNNNTNSSSIPVPAPFVEGSPEDTNLWNGLRVRIGISRGYGDIRKDPVSLGYDYYGTVVNTAARVEGVGHGGQILITEETNVSLKKDFVIGRGGVAVNLGPQPLRGLDAPIKLFQISPSSLHSRKFPPLRLHIEADLDDRTTETTTTTTTSSSAATFTPMELAAQLCATRQFQGIVSVDEILSNLNVFQTIMSPTKPKWQIATLTKLGDSWGFERSAKAVLHDSTRMKLVVNLMGRVTKTLNMNAKRHESNNGNGTGGGSSSGGKYRTTVATTLTTRSSENRTTHSHNNTATKFGGTHNNPTTAAADDNQQQQLQPQSHNHRSELPGVSIIATRRSVDSRSHSVGKAAADAPSLVNASASIMANNNINTTNNNNNNSSNNPTNISGVAGVGAAVDPTTAVTTPSGSSGPNVVSVFPRHDW